MTGFKCRSCGAAIFWARTPNGKAIPLDAEPTEDGNVVVNGGQALVFTKGSPTVADGTVKYTCHFQTCKDAAKHRKRG